MAGHTVSKKAPKRSFLQRLIGGSSIAKKVKGRKSRIDAALESSVSTTNKQKKKSGLRKRNF